MFVCRFVPYIGRQQTFVMNIILFQFPVNIPKSGAIYTNILSQIVKYPYLQAISRYLEVFTDIFSIKHHIEMGGVQLFITECSALVERDMLCSINIFIKNH